LADRYSGEEGKEGKGGRDKKRREKREGVPYTHVYHLQSTIEFHYSQSVAAKKGKKKEKRKKREGKKAPLAGEIAASRFVSLGRSGKEGKEGVKQVSGLFVNSSLASGGEEGGGRREETGQFCGNNLAIDDVGRIGFFLMEGGKRGGRGGRKRRRGGRGEGRAGRASRRACHRPAISSCLFVCCRYRRGGGKKEERSPWNVFLASIIQFPILRYEGGGGRREKGEKSRDFRLFIGDADISRVTIFAKPFHQLLLGGGGKRKG